MAEMISPAEQITRVATLLGRAVLRWKRKKEQSSEISEIDSDSLPEGLEFSPVSSLSVTGQNDAATSLEETSSELEMIHQTMCEEQQTKIAALIVEAIWRHANKLAEQRSIATTEPETPPSDAPNEATTHNDKEADDES